MKAMENKKIGVAYKDKMVSQSLLNCEGIKIFQIEDGTVKNSYDIKNTLSKRTEIAKLLAKEKIKALIIGVISAQSRAILYDNNIYFLADVEGDVDEVATDYLKYDACSMDDLFGEGYEDCHSCGSKNNNGECDGNCGCNH